MLGEWFIYAATSEDDDHILTTPTHSRLKNKRRRSFTCKMVWIWLPLYIATTPPHDTVMNEHREEKIYIRSVKIRFENLNLKITMGKLDGFVFFIKNC